MQGSTKIPITDLNAYIICKICNGYFVDACTIIECLHTFCRSCIIRYLQKNKYCPVCDVQVHKSKPLLNIRPDKTLQDIVYKLVPRLFQNEMQRRREFYESRPEAKPSSLEQCGEVAYQDLLTPEETTCLTLSYHGAENKPRYLRCPAAVTMGHLKKLIRAKYDLSENHRVDILYNQDCLSSSLTLIDIAYIYLWKTKGPIELTYRIYKNTTKKLKLEQPQNNENTEANNINNNNWKEVQLRISENGEMSITGIQDTLSPNLLQIVNSEPKYKNDRVDQKFTSEPASKKDMPGLKYIGKVNTALTISDPLPIDNLNSLTDSIGNYSTTINTSAPAFSLSTSNDSLTITLSSPSSRRATLSSGSTTTVFSTINTSKCSTKTAETIINIEKAEEFFDDGTVESDKRVKRKRESNTELEPPIKQPKPIILNHNLLNLSNNHPLKKHSKFNRNGEYVRDNSNTKLTTNSEIKSFELFINAGKPNDSETSILKKMEIDVPKTTIKNFAQGRIGTSTNTSKPLAMRAKTLISETGVKPPCYQPRTIYNPLINVPRSLNTTNSSSSLNLSSKIETKNSVSQMRSITPQKSDKSTTNTLSSQCVQIYTPKPPVPESQPITKPRKVSFSVTNKSRSNSPILPTQSVVSSNKGISVSSPQQIQSNINVTRVQSTRSCEASSIQVVMNKQITTSPPQQPQSSSAKTSVLNRNSTPSPTNQNTMGKMSIKAKPSTPIGYKTLRDPPKSWNSQISRANQSKSSPDQKYSDLKNVRPAKFFKMRNNIPRYLGNPASGVKPMYQVHASPEKDKSCEIIKSEKIEIKKHSIVKIDPKTLKPVSEKAPETTSLSNHSSILQTTKLNSHGLTTGQFYPNPNQFLNTAVTTMSSAVLNIQNDLKINTSSVSIINPLKLQSSSPKNERKSPKSPNSPKTKTTSSPTGTKRDKIPRNFTPPNPFIPNIPTKPSLSKNQFIYPAIPAGFPTYDPRLMAAYYNQWYSQRMPFPPSAISGLNLDLNQMKSLELLASPASPKIDVLTSMLIQVPSRPCPTSSINISPLQRSHNEPPTPKINKPCPATKKPIKELKNDKSLETVVEKMTQNRNKVTSIPQNKFLKEAPQDEKIEVPKPPSLPETQTNDSDSVKKILDYKPELNIVTENIENETNELLKIATSNAYVDSDKTEVKNDQKLLEYLEPIKTISSNSQMPDNPNNSGKVPEQSGKENSNTQNTIEYQENIDKKVDVICKENKSVKKDNETEDNSQVEVKEKD